MRGALPGVSGWAPGRAAPAAGSRRRRGWPGPRGRATPISSSSALTQRVEDGLALHVGGHLDRLAQRPPRLGERAVGHEATIRQAALGGVELGLGPGTGADVGTHGEAPVELGEEADLGGVESGRRPRRRVGVAAVLAQRVGQPPQVAHRDRPADRGSAGRRTAACPLAAAVPPLAPAGRWRGSIPSGSGPEDPDQLADRAAGARRTDGRRVDLGPTELDRWDHRLGVEHGEGGRDHLTRHLSHHRTAAREVGRPVRQLHTAGQGARAGPRSRARRRPRGIPARSTPGRPRGSSAMARRLAGRPAQLGHNCHPRGRAFPLTFCP